MKLLLIEDDAAVRESLSLLLTLRGHEVHTAACSSSGQAALQSLTDLQGVVSDFQLLERTAADFVGLPEFQRAHCES